MSARERQAVVQRQDGSSSTSRCTMHQIGVMPMPPAIRTVWAASSLSGKLLRGALILSVLPTRSSSWMKREPPRLAGSRLMPNV